VPSGPTPEEAAAAEAAEAQAAAQRRAQAAAKRRQAQAASARRKAAAERRRRAQAAQVADAGVAASPSIDAEGLSGSGSGATEGPLVIGLIALGILALGVVGVLVTSRGPGLPLSRRQTGAWAASGVRWSPDRSTGLGDRALVAIGAVIAIGGGFVAAYYLTTLL
jgi:hypothetical protein